MRKNNEGYVLAMVMAVIAVLAVVASAMLSVGLRNVQTQQAAILRMQAKYEIEGVFEKVIAELALQKINGNVEANVEQEFKDAITTRLENYNNDNNTGNNDRIIISQIEWPQEESGKVCYFTVETENEKIKAKAKIKLKYKVEQPEQVIEKRTASVDTMEFVSYEIINLTE